MPFAPLSEKQADRALDEVFSDTERCKKFAAYMKSLAMGDLSAESFGRYIQILIEHTHDDIEESLDAEKGLDSSTPLRSA